MGTRTGRLRRWWGRDRGHASPPDARPASQSSGRSIRRRARRSPAPSTALVPVRVTEHDDGPRFADLLALLAAAPPARPATDDAWSDATRWADEAEILRWRRDEDDEHPAYPGEGPDPFEVLGLRPGAPWPVISSRHKELARAHHPDRFEGDHAHAAAVRMSEVNAAYSELRRFFARMEPGRSPTADRSA